MFIGTPCILKVHFLESSQKQSLMFENQKINANSNQGRLQGGLIGVGAGLVKYIFLGGLSPRSRRVLTTRKFLCTPLVKS